jgi:hypothetical protein
MAFRSNGVRSNGVWSKKIGEMIFRQSDPEPPNSIYPKDYLTESLLDRAPFDRKFISPIFSSKWLFAQKHV